MVDVREQLQKISQLFKTKLQTCKNVGRNLAEFLDSERCKSVNLVDLIL